MFTIIKMESKFFILWNKKYKTTNNSNSIYCSRPGAYLLKGGWEGLAPSQNIRQVAYAKSAHA